MSFASRRAPAPTRQVAAPHVLPSGTPSPVSHLAKSTMDFASPSPFSGAAFALRRKAAATDEKSNPSLASLSLVEMLTLRRNLTDHQPRPDRQKKHAIRPCATTIAGKHRAKEGIARPAIHIEESETIMLSQIDHDILLCLNTITINAFFRPLFYAIGFNPLIRGFPIFFPLAVLWFYDDYDKRRSRMLIGLLTTCLVLFLSRWMQYHVNIHTRPLLDETLSIYNRENISFDTFGRLGSFPSDTATLYFSLVTIIFLERPLLGSMALLWSLVTVGLVRVAVGWHYPSDIVGAMVLGPGCVYLISKIKYVGLLSERLLYIFRSRAYIIHSLFVIFVAEAYNLFPGLSGIVDILKTAYERLIKSS